MTGYNGKNIWRNLWNTVVNVCVTAAACIIAAVLILNVWGIKEYIVLSGSMEPAIHTGSICGVNTRIDYSEIRQGDIICFRMGEDVIVTHRALRITDSGIETKGDANELSDGITTTENNYVGKVLFSIPEIGYCLRYMHDPRIKIIFSTTAVCLLILSLVTGGKDNSKYKKLQAAGEKQ